MKNGRFSTEQIVGILRGLVYMRNRWYDRNTGRFTQEDPIGYAGGINLYAYAGGDPVTYSDPFGLCAEAADGDDSTKVQSRYAHLSETCVKEGKHVKKGQLIGYSGGAKGHPNSGTSTGPHLHFEMRIIRDGAANTLSNAASTPVNPVTQVAKMNGAAPIAAFANVNSGFGMREHPVTGVMQGHKGVDVRIPVGTPVYAAHSGTVVLSGRVSGYGLSIYIDH